MSKPVPAEALLVATIRQLDQGKGSRPHAYVLSTVVLC